MGLRNLVLAVLLLCVYSLVQGRPIQNNGRFIKHETELNVEPMTFKRLLQQATFTATPTPTPTRDQIYYPVPYDGSRATPTNKWPRNLLDSSIWVGYAVYVLLVFLTSWIVLTLTCNIMFYFWCCRCCFETCGDAKPTVSNGYDKTERRKLYIPMIIFLVIITILTILGVIFVALFAAEVPKVVTQTENVISNSLLIVNNVLQVVRTAVNQLPAQFDSVFALLGYLYQYNQPLDGINASINGTIANLYAIQNDTYNINNSTVAAARIIRNLASNNVSVPDISGLTIPDISPFVQSTVSLLGDVQNQVTNAKDALAQGVEGAKQNLNTQGRSGLNQVVNATNQAIDGFKTVLEGVEATVNSATVTVNLVVTILDIVIAVIICIFICSAFVLYAILLAVALPTSGNSAGCFKASSCCTFFFSWIFYLFSGVCIVLWALTTDVCTNAEPTLANALVYAQYMINDNAAQYNISAANITVAGASNNILYCSGNQSFLSAFNINLKSIVNLGQYQSQISDGINNAIDQFNLSTTLNASLTALSVLNSPALSFTNVSSQLDTVQTQINNLYAYYSNFSNFGFNYDLYFNSLILLNNFTFPYNFTYTFQNYTLLNPNNPPWSNDNNVKGNVTVLRNYVDTNVTLYNRYSTFASPYLGNLTLLNYTLADIRNNLTDINNIKNQFLGAGPATIAQTVLSFDTITKAFKANVTSTAAGFFNVVYNAFDGVDAALQCSYFGTSYQNVKSSLCNKMTGYAGVSGLSAIFIGIITCVMFCLLLIGTKRFGYKADVESYGAVMSPAGTSPILMSPNASSPNNVEMQNFGNRGQHDLERDR